MRNDFVATGYVVTPDRTKILLVHHGKLGKWIPPGGHFEGHELPHECALREVEEETGVRATIVPSGEQLGLHEPEESQVPTPYCILYERIPAVGDDEEHMHVDFIYILEAAAGPLRPQLHEVHEARWCTSIEVEALETFTGVREIARRVLTA